MIGMFRLDDILGYVSVSPQPTIALVEQKVEVARRNGSSLEVLTDVGEAVDV